MTALQRGFLCALAAPALLFGACLARPDFARRVNLDVWTLPELECQIEDGRLRYERDAEKIRAADEQADECGRAVDDLIAGRSGVPEVVARFRDLNRAHPGSLRALRCAYPGDSDEELCRRQVVQFVEGRLMAMPTAEADRVRARLGERLDKDR